MLLFAISEFEYADTAYLQYWWFDDGKVDVNIKGDCGDTPLIAVCHQTTLQSQEEAFKFINYLWQNSCKFKKSNDLGKTAMNYARRNGLTKIIKTLEYIQWKILYNTKHVYYKITMNIVVENITFMGRGNRC